MTKPIYLLNPLFRGVGQKHPATILVQPGDTGSLVRRIQKQLNEQNSVDISIIVDGVYGSATTSAVRKFQEALEQRVDGLAGPVTMNLLDLEAVHPVTQKTILQFLESNDDHVEIKEADKQGKTFFKNLVEDNIVFRNNIPSDEEPKLGDQLAVLYISQDIGKHPNLVFLISTLINEPNVRIYGILDRDTEELLSLTILNIDGDQYESNTHLVSYDINGEVVVEREDTTLELTQENLDIQLEISKLIQDTTNNSMYISPYGLDAGEYTCQVGAGLLTAGGCYLLSFLGGPFVIKAQINYFKGRSTLKSATAPLLFFNHLNKTLFHVSKTFV